MKSSLQDVLSLISGTVFEVDYQRKVVIDSYINGTKFIFDCDVDDFFVDLFKKMQCKLKAISIHDLVTWVLALNDEKNNLSFDIIKANGEEKRNEISKHVGNDYITCLIDSFDNSVVYSLLDSMTGLYQKETFSSLVNEAFLDADNNSFYFLIIDIDNFKAINDNYGHLFGDQVIKEIATIIKKEFENGIVGRFGGDEFAVLVFSPVDYDTVRNQNYAFSKKIKDYLFANYPNIGLGITIGCSRYGIDGFSYDELFMKADKALYYGKFKNKNCFVIYDDTLYAESVKANNHDSSNYLYNTKVELQFFVDLFYFLSNSLQLEEALQGVVHNIRRYFMTDRVLIYLMDGYQAKLKATSCAPNPLANPSSLNHTFNPNLWISTMVKYYSKISNVDNIKQNNPQLANSLISENVESVYLLELIHDDEIVGYLRLDNCSKKRRWVYKEDDILQAVANVLASHIYLHRKK